MSTNNMSDEELDRLFRKSADHYDPPFDEEAWAAMERKLDGAQGGGAGIKRYLPGALLALLVAVGLVWMFLEREASPPKTAAIPAAQLGKENPGFAAESEVAAESHHAKGAASTTLPEPPSPAAPYPAVHPGSGDRIAEKSVQERNAIPDRNAIPVTPIPEDHAIPERAALTALAIPANRFAGEEEPLQTVEAVIPMTRQLEPKPVAGIARQVAPLPIPDRAPIPADSNQAVERQQRVLLRSVGVTLVVAPDITTVRFKHRDAVSANAGVLLSVPITRRLSLVTGAVWANKRYQATPAEYKPSPDYWDGKRLPDVIAAQCRVLDIPVNLQYQVLGWGKNTLSVQAGLSSYLMLNEAYTYTYYYPGRDSYEHTREFSNKNRHWFGIQNLSVGYTRQLSPAITIGAQPFVKIPLASIGEGRVKLTSAGVFFTAGYTLK